MKNKKVDNTPLTINELGAIMTSITSLLQRSEPSEAAICLEAITNFCTLLNSAYKRNLQASFPNGLLKEAMEENKEERPDAVHVYICDKPVWLDLHNLRDKNLAIIRNPGDRPNIHPDEHYFSHNLATKAATIQKKRLLTPEEQKHIKLLPWQWDNRKKGIWITFNKVEGGTIEIFFPASGYRLSNSGEFNNVGWHGFIRSSNCAAVYSHNLIFGPTYVTLQTTNSSMYDFPIRCVSDI